MPLVTEATTRPHISFSQLQLAAQCGEAYRRKYIAGHPGDTMNVPALVGSAFHAAVEQWESIHFRHEKMLTEDYDWEGAHTQLVLLTKKKVNQILNEHPVTEDELIHFGQQDLEHFRREKIPQISQTYLDWRQEEISTGWEWYGDAPEDMLEVEAKADIGGYPFLGVIDMLYHDSQGRLVLRDLKTGKTKPYHAMQLEQYRLALRRAYGIDAAYGQLLYVKRKKPYVQVVKWALSDEDIDEMANRLRNNVEGNTLMVNGPFTGHCAVCDFSADCQWGNVTPHGSS